MQHYIILDGSKYLLDWQSTVKWQHGSAVALAMNLPANVGCPCITPETYKTLLLAACRDSGMSLRRSRGTHISTPWV